MKALFTSCILFIPHLAWAQSDPFYDVQKYMIQSTASRVQAGKRSDFKTACHFERSVSGMDTKAYYLSFELLDHSATLRRFQNEVGTDATRKYKLIHQQSLALVLHQACLQNDFIRVARVLSEMETIYNQP
ncbi:MAG: hypothetical protein H7333_00935 [Bdellovibrionales bacterium]|nr:hypothetical protein [Oligoflexia bacterium]